MTRPIAFETEQRGDICILRICGRLAAGVDVDYRRQADQVKSLGCRKLILDICEVDSIGSSGIGFFVDLYTSITKNPEGRFVLAGTSPRVMEVLTITRLSTILPVAKDVAAALAFCAGEAGDGTAGKALHAG